MPSIDQLESEALGSVAGATSTSMLREIELKYLGKSGSYSSLLKEIGKLPAEERPTFGQKVNEAKARLQEAIDERTAFLKIGERAAQFEQERIDITMPGRKTRIGRQHIMSKTMDKIKSVFVGLGFTYYDAPDIELFKYNFDALNYPPDHPAMDDQDTFYIDDERLLRTQGTAFQGRVLEHVKPPFKAFTIARTYRNESVDRTHGHTFHQIDAFMIDENISMAHLKGTLGLFARAMFGDDAKVRFRPDFFPFVEPGVDYAISTPKLFDGKWVELGGAGLIHPNILRAHGIDIDRYSGFAFGLGVERIPMMAYGIDDLRHLLDNDLRFLNQFA